MAFFDSALSGRPNIVLRINANVVSQDVAGNFSVVDWSVFLIKTSASSAWNSSPSDWGANVNGQIFGGQFTYDFNNVANGGAIQLAGGRVNVPHNADGTKNLYVSTGVNGYDPIGTATAVGTFDLPTIPRATVPNWAGHFTPGEAKTINLPRAVGSFVHTVDWFFGSMSGQVGTGFGTSASWTPSYDMLNMIPNNASGVGTMRVSTYNGVGGPLIGQQSVAFQLLAPADAVPSFDTITVDEAVTSVKNEIGAFVQSLSRLILAITGAVGYRGSTISSYKIEVAGLTVNAQSGTTMSAIQSSGAVEVKGTVIDSRGRTATKSVTIQVLPYVPPQITSISGQRALPGGTPDDEGAYIRVNMIAAVKSLQVGGVEKNTLTYKIFTRLRGTVTFELKTTTTNPDIALSAYALVDGTYPITNAYDVRTIISDKFNSSQVEFTIATSTIFMHWDAALGVGIGKYRQNGMLDVLGEVYHRDGSLVEPPGMISAYAGPGATPPKGWLLCNGGAVSRVTYARLFALIGTLYGAGDGTNTFNVPNMRGRMPVGYDLNQAEFNARGKLGGVKTVMLNANQSGLPAHTHKQLHAATGGSQNAPSATLNVAGSMESYLSTGTATQASALAAHENLPPYIALDFLIKT